MDKLLTYINQSEGIGKYLFTISEATNQTGLSYNSVINAISRLKKLGRIASIYSGLYEIIPFRYSKIGSLPADQLIPIVMDHFEAKYYVALLSAASYYGAAHQKIAKFQVVINKRISKRKTLSIGKVEIEFIYRKRINHDLINQFSVYTGKINVSCPELTCLELIANIKKSGGVSHIATIFIELIEALDAQKLNFIFPFFSIPSLQRFGYILDHIKTYDENKKEAILYRIMNFLETKKKHYQLLDPSLIKLDSTKNKKWTIIENVKIETDI